MLVNFVIFFRFSSHLLFSFFFFLFSALKFFSLFIWAFPLVVGVFVAAAVSSHIFMLMRPSLFFILVVVFLLFPPHWCFVVFSSPLKKNASSRTVWHALLIDYKKGGKTFARTTKNQRRKPKISIKKPRKSGCNFLGTRFFIFLLIILFLCLCGFLCLLWYFVDDCSAIKVYFLPL